MKLILPFLVLLCLSRAVYAQSPFKGVVTEAGSNKPVPYVSIGIIGKAIGTVTNQDGEFEINLEINVNENDTLVFTSIGYRPQTFLVTEFKRAAKPGSINVKMQPSTTELKTVTVHSKHTEMKILGYETNSKLFGVGFGTHSIGSQGGVLIPIKHENTQIENLSFFIIQNSFASMTFRVNVYQIKNGMPEKNILNENIIFKVDNMRTGKITVDLEAYSIIVNQDVLVALEWLEAKPETTGILDVGAKLFGSTYIRQTSQTFWQKKRPAVGISVKANY